MMQYEAFAQLYDTLTFDVDYQKIADYLERQFARRGGVSLVTDLACGTGSLTLELARRGYDMIGIDQSAEMLAEARMKIAGSADAPGGASPLGDRILLLEQDLRSFELYGTVDAAVCALDSVNYVTEGLPEVFRLIHNYLNPGGLFLFDINSEYKFRHVLADNVFTYETDGIFYVWENQLEEPFCDFLLDFFVEQAGGDYRRFSEQHTERVYTCSELDRMLADSGLNILDRYDDYSDAPVRADSERICYVCEAVK